MLYSRFTIVLALDEASALRTLAKKERREPRAQAELIIRDELERLGLLTSEAQKSEITGVADERADHR